MRVKWVRGLGLGGLGLGLGDRVRVRFKVITSSVKQLTTT